MGLAIATESTSPPCHWSTHQNPVSPRVPVSVSPHPEMKQEVATGRKKSGTHAIFTYFVSIAQWPSTGCSLSSAGEEINNNKNCLELILIPNHCYQCVMQPHAKLHKPSIPFAPPVLGLFPLFSSSYAVTSACPSQFTSQRFKWVQITIWPDYFQSIVSMRILHWL